MYRPVGLGTQVFHRLDDPDTKKLFPDPVHPDPGGQRMLLGDAPLRQPQAVHRSFPGKRRKHSGKAPSDFGTGFVVFPSLKDEGRLWLRHFFHHHHARDRGWDSLLTGQHYLNEGNNKQLQLVPFLARLAAEA